MRTSAIVPTLCAITLGLALGCNKDGAKATAVPGEAEATAEGDNAAAEAASDEDSAAASAAEDEASASAAAEGEGSEAKAEAEPEGE